MRNGARRTTLTVALAATVLSVLAGTARADVTSPPADPSSPSSPASPSTPSTGTPSPTPTPTPTTDPTGTPGPITWPSTNPSAPDHSQRPSVPPSSGSTTTAPTPTPTVVPGPPSDGVAPTAGQVDEFLSLTAERTTAAALVSTTATALEAAHAEVVGLESKQAQLALLAAGADAAVATTQASTDAAAAEMYQQGDGGLGAIGTALTTGPDGFLANLTSLTMLHAASNAVVDDAETARTNLALVKADQTTTRLLLEQARATETRAAAASSDAVTALAAIDARLKAIDIVAPQVAVGPDGCPTQDLPATLRGGAATFGAAKLCREAVRQAATPQAALAITWAFQHLGAAYACGGAGRLLPFRADCSSFVSRAYHEGAGLATAGAGWAPTTRDMVPWGGATLDPHYSYVDPAGLRPGDLVLYDTCPQGGCAYKHVVMYLGSPDNGKTFWMIHTNACGDVAKVEPFWGFPTTGSPFLVARRVIALPGEKVLVPTAAQARARAAAASSLVTAPPVG